MFPRIISAALAAIVGGLTIAGALGVMRFIAIFGPVHFFAQPVVTLIGLGIAVDYGLFVVSSSMGSRCLSGHVPKGRPTVRSR